MTNDFPSSEVLPILGHLVPVSLREVWADKASDFTPWLARPENLAALDDALGSIIE
jgi:hypothetical protein